MPTYDFVCQDCGHPFEKRMSMSAYSEGAKPACPECGSENAERSFTSVSVLTGSRSGGSNASSSSGCGHSGFT
jgi:putative FmdB family regulatory protein